MSKLLFIPLPGNEAMAQRLAELTGAETDRLELRDFPDGETYVAFPHDVKSRDVALVSSLASPNSKFLPLAFAARTARELGAGKVGLVAPYLSYMRQDKRFHAGEAVTSRIFASLLSQCFDWLVTADPHLHRYKTLGEIYSIPTSVAHAAAPIGKWIAENVEQPFLIGPDEESAQWVSQVAEIAGADHVVLAKQRLGDEKVAIATEGLDRIGGATPVLVDDIIASGATILKVLHALKANGARPAYVIGVHGILAGNSAQLIEQEGARLITTNSVPHSSNRIDIAEPLAKALIAVQGVTSVSSTEA